MTIVDRIRWRISARTSIDRHVALVEASGLFDRAFYSRQAGRIFDGDAEAIRDYLLRGDQRGIAPNPMFDGVWYRRRYRDVAAEGINPLIHYILHGAAELRDPHPLFHAEHYVESQTAGDARANALHHFLNVDAEPLRSPHPLFLGDYYREHNADIATGDRPLFFHFLERGGFETRAFHPLFDHDYYTRHNRHDPGRHILAAFLAGPRDACAHYLFDPGYYLRTNPDVAATSINPLLHYARQGSRERRTPHPVFDQGWYMDRHPEAALARETALGHYLRYGLARGYQPSRYFDATWYAQTHASLIDGGSKPIEHYVTVGLKQNLQPSPAFDPAYYLETNPDIDAGERPAFTHFMQHGRFEHRRALDPSVKGTTGRFAVVLHLFYLDLLPELESYLKPLEDMVDILVSVPRERQGLFEPIVKAAFPSAKVVPVANKGRDVGALFELAGRVDLSGYTAVCKLHTKKGITERDVWRHMMLRCLVGNASIADSIVDAFRTNDDLWFVGPADFHISTRRFIGPNAKGVLSLFAEMYPHAWPDFDWGFFAGTMFWFRPAAIERLAAALDRIGGFEEERLTNDGGLAHAIERLFLLSCAVEGKLVGRVAFEPGPAELRLDVLPPTEGISREEPADTLARFACLLDGKVHRSVPPPTQARPVPAEAPKLEPAVNLIGPLAFLNGLGISARAYLALLREAGVDVNVVNWVQGFERLSRIDIPLPASEAAAATNIVHINLDLLRAGDFLETGALSAQLAKARRNILVFYWELPTLKPEWVPLVRRFDEVWCPTTFIRDMVHAACDVPTRLLRPDLGAATRREGPDGAHLGAPGGADRAFVGLPDDRFVFAYFADGGSIMKRKNPETLVRAFIEEFDEDAQACCYLKIHYPGQASAELERLREIVGTRKDVIIAGELYDDAEMQVLFQSIDCYVSPHRSEGLGLTIIEAMQNGKPVIATPYGGSSDFVAEAHAYPLDYTLVEVGPGCEPYPENFVWADPSIASLRRQMREVFVDRRGAQRKAAAAREALRRVVEENRAAARAIFALDPHGPLLPKETGSSPALIEAA